MPDTPEPDINASPQSAVKAEARNMEDEAIKTSPITKSSSGPKKAAETWQKDSKVVSLPKGKARVALLSRIEQSAFEGAKRALAHANLENPIGEKILPFDAAPKGAAENMGSKFQQRIEVGQDQDGKPVYRWATGNTLADFTKAVCRINTEYLNPVSEGVPVSEGAKRVLFEDYAQHWYKVFAEPHLEPTVRPVLQKPDFQAYHSGLHGAICGRNHDAGHSAVSE